MDGRRRPAPAIAALYTGTVLIRNMYTGKCLTLAAAATDDDVAIVQRPCFTQGSLQHWRMHSMAC